MAHYLHRAENRAIIKKNYLKGISATKTREQLVKLYGESALSYTTVHRWYTEFKQGRRSTEDIARTGRPAVVNTLKNIEEVHQLLMEDRRMSVRMIADLTYISMGSSVRILNHQLNLKKMNECWVPRTLTDEQKAERMSCAGLCLDLIQNDSEDFFNHYISVDSSWVYYKEATESSSPEPTDMGSPKRRKDDFISYAKTLSSQKTSVMVTIFWDSLGIIYMDFMDQNQFMTTEYYSAVIKQLHEELLEKRPHLINKKIYVHHYEPDRIRNRLEVATSFPRFEYIDVPQAPCSPDLSPSNYFFYPTLKRWIQSHKFKTRTQFVKKTRKYLDAMIPSFYAEGILNLEQRLKKCIELNGDYLDK